MRFNLLYIFILGIQNSDYQLSNSLILIKVYLKLKLYYCYNVNNFTELKNSTNYCFIESKHMK
jgi:hypothetical protein